MFKWDHEYEDYNGNKRNESFYFNFNKGELMDLEWRTPGGIEAYMKHIMAMQDGQKLADMFGNIIDKSYGVKGPDGREFIKNEQVLNHFKFTEAYSDLRILLATDDKFAAQFVNGIFPKEAVEAAKKQKEMAEKAGILLVSDKKETVDTVAEDVPMVEGQQNFSQPTV